MTTEDLLVVLAKHPELPAKPARWTKSMTMHLNFGREGGVGSYEIRDHDGLLVPIQYQYDTRKGGLTGFSLPEVDGVMTWAELCAAWPGWAKSRTPVMT